MSINQIESSFKILASCLSIWLQSPSIITDFTNLEMVVGTFVIGLIFAVFFRIFQ